MTNGSEIVTLARVSKRFFRKPGILSVAAELLGRDASGSVWALRDVDLKVRRGERLGIVGANGAGKTTLLRLLSGVITPTRGARSVQGRVLALSEMQACLHRELTGRENIPLLASLAGLSRHEVAARLGEVLAFSGLSLDALDTPVKNYSSGMATRLAISVAATARADLIVVDEGIAGGDASFRRQCFDRLRDLAHDGCTVVLASHDIAELRTHCDRCLHLQHGCVVAEGAPDEVLAGYQNEEWVAAEPERTRTTSDLPTLELELRLSVQSKSDPLPSDSGLEIELRYSTAQVINGVTFGIEVVTPDGARVYRFRSPVGADAWTLAPGSGAAVLRVPRVWLSPGAYRANMEAWDRSLTRRLLWRPGPVFVISGSRDATSGSVLPPVHEWTRR